MFWLWTLLLYWLVFFVASYFVMEQAQNYFYDEVTKGAPWRVALGSFIFAALLTWRNPTTLDMFTSRIGETAMLAIVAWVVYVLILSYHPQHAAFVGPLSVIFVAAVTALAVESLADSGRSLQRDRPTNNLPLRKSAGGSGLQPIPKEEAGVNKAANPAAPDQNAKP
jgi:hypothetical protein